MHVVHAGNGHDHGVQPGDHHDDGGTAGHSGDHLCCHFTVSGPSVLTLPAALPEFPVRAFAPDPVHDLFVPDQPQRPPLV